MSFDFKKEYKEFYLPKQQPQTVCIPKMNFIAVKGKGDPNQENGEYKQALEALYTIAYTIKMSYKGEHKIDGFYQYVVPPLEGLWWQEGVCGMNYSRKDELCFISMIRLPDFVTENDVTWAKKTAEQKKQKDFSKVEFFTYEEGECVQCMHIGSYDDEPATLALMENFMEANGFECAVSDTLFHHEIYLSDPRKCNPANLKTVIRHPIRKKTA